MKRFCSLILVLILVMSPSIHLKVHAVGEGNIDGGGGDMESGTSENLWNSGNEGMRIVVVKNDGTPVTTPIDLTNKRPDIQMHFGKVCKLSYISNGLSPNTDQ